MKSKTIRSISAMALAVFFAFCVTATTAFAEELPVDIPTPEKASVSQKVDVSNNKDPDISTKFYMYIPQDVVANDYPQMGDEGISTQWLLAGAMISGVVFLGMTAYANSEEKSHIA